MAVREFEYATDLEHPQALEILIDHICRTAKRDVEIVRTACNGKVSSVVVLLTDAEARIM